MNPSPVPPSLILYLKKYNEMLEARDFANCAIAASEKAQDELGLSLGRLIDSLPNESPDRLVFVLPIEDTFCVIEINLAGEYEDLVASPESTVKVTYSTPLNFLKN